MDKKANSDKRKKNLSFKSHKSKKEQEPKVEKDSTSIKPEEILPNNWSKYEINENDEPEGADFETLLQEPISNNSHFKFKCEQNWDADIKSQLELNKYFTLDLKFLGEGISTIPFPKRHNYNEDLFTYVELESIKKHSETNSQKYNKLLAKKFPAKDNKIIIKKNLDEIKPKAVGDKSVSSMQTFELKQKTIESEISETNEWEVKTNESKFENSNLNQATVEKQNISREIKSVEIPIEPKGQRQRMSKKHDDDIDDLLNLKTPQRNADEPEIKAEDPLMNPIVLKQIPVPQPTVDLEQWLDDILDD